MKHETLSNLRVSTPDTPRHQAALRQAILSYEPRKQPLVTRLGRRLANPLGVPTMNHKIFGATGIAVVAILVAVATVYTPLNPRVAAQELAKDSLQAVKQLSASELANLKQSLAADPLQALQEATSAKDITRISKDDFNTLVKDSSNVNSHYSDENGVIWGRVDGNAPGSIVAPGSSSVPAELQNSSRTPDTQNTRTSGSDTSEQVDTPALGAIDSRLGNATSYLKYTNKSGNVAVIALDSNNKPVYLVTLQ